MLLHTSDQVWQNVVAGLRYRGSFVFIDHFSSVLSFSSVALMNHSCSPNVIVTYKGTVAEVRAVQEINPGDEVRKTPESVTLSSLVKWKRWCYSVVLVLTPSPHGFLLSVSIHRSLTVT